MGELWYTGAECAIEQNLLWRVRDVIVATHDQRDLHVDVIGNDGHVVDRRLVRAQHHKIFDVLVGKRDALVYEVQPLGRSLRHLEPNDERFAARELLRLFLRREIGHATVETERQSPRIGVGAQALELREWCEIAVRVSTGEQSLGVGLMTLDVRALIDNGLIPHESEPFESFEDRAGAFVGAAGAVGVLDAQQEITVVLPCVEPVEEGGAGAAHVQETRGGWSEAHARALGHRRHMTKPDQKVRGNCWSWKLTIRCCKRQRGPADKSSGPAERRKRDSNPR